MTRKENDKYRIFSKRNVVASLVFLITSGSAAFWQVYIYYDDIHQSNLSEDIRFEKSLQIIEDVYSLLNTLITDTRASKAMLLRVQDSGDIPVPGKDLYSSIVYEVYGPDSKPFKKKWRHQLIDQEYVKHLSKVAREGKAKLFTDEMPPGILKDIYVSKDIVMSCVFAIHQEPAYFFYVSITFKIRDEMTPSERVAIRSAIQSLRNIFEERRKFLTIVKKG
jgi:hypothetical protein